ncbi:hypothetical protein B9Z19DRAFT_1061460 [Tuber borchii]|uniref:Uncharacterized protein n=1 Tax=Tuber borchii TaxID=42251 RepID=A0A2T7A5A7_TUBBO|nr:hypothetical protein B9Z19DRAFT_1061460 [Tuber borchii]
MCYQFEVFLAVVGSLHVGSLGRWPPLLYECNQSQNVDSNETTVSSNEQDIEQAIALNSRGLIDSNAIENGPKAKSSCCQPLWRWRKKLREQENEEKSSEAETSDWERWPRLSKVGYNTVKSHILSQAIRNLRRYLKSMKCKFQGLDLDLHKQLLELMRFQRLSLTKETWRMPRTQGTALVAATSEKGRFVALRILKVEQKAPAREYYITLE